MLVTIPSAVRHDEEMMPSYYEEHFLERISNLEFRLGQLADRMSQALDLMLRQSRTIQLDHLLIETLVDALSSAGLLEGEKISQNWKEKVRAENDKQTLTDRRDIIRQKILSHRNATKTSSFTNLVKEGFKLLNLEKNEESLVPLEKAAALAPDNAPLLAFIGEQHFHQQKMTLACDYLKRAQVLMPSYEKTRLLLGLACAEEGETEEAEKYLQTLKQTRQVVPLIGFVLGFIFASQSRWTESLAAFKKLSAAFSTAETHYLIGSAYSQIGRGKLAYRHLQKAVELDANYADAWFMLGTNYLKQGDELGAKSALSMAVAAKDSTAQCHNFLKNLRREAEFAATPLVFLRLSLIRKNLLSGLTPRISRLYFELLEKVTDDEKGD